MQLDSLVLKFQSLDVMLFNVVFFFNDTATTEIYTLSLHDALPILLARFGTLGADAEGVVEVALERGEPRDGPTHALPVGLDPGDRRAGDERKGGVARMEVGEVADLVDDHRAAAAARLLVGAEHEVVEDELTAPLEEIEEVRLAV